jgi:hypothetical protein
MKTTNQLRKECESLENASKRGEIKILSHRRGWAVKDWHDEPRSFCERYLKYARYKIT